MTTDTTYWVNGVALDDPTERWFLAQGGLHFAPLSTPARGGLQLPGREGLFYTGHQPYSPTILPIRVGITSNGANGSHGGDALLATNLQRIAGIMHQRSELTLERLQGGVRTSVSARIASSTQPEWLGPRDAIIAFLLELSPPFWAETTEQAWAGVTPAPTATATLDALAGSTAPICNGRFIANGTMTSLTLTDDATGRWLRVTATTTAAQSLHVDIAKMRAWITPTATPDVDGTDVTGALDIGPGGFSLTPVQTATSSTVSLSIARTAGNGLVRAVGLRKAWL